MAQGSDGAKLKLLEKLLKAAGNGQKRRGGAQDMRRRIHMSLPRHILQALRIRGLLAELIAYKGQQPQQALHLLAELQLRGLSQAHISGGSI